VIVIDASALTKYLLHEEGWEKIGHYLYENRPLYSVDHLLKEAGNALWRHCCVTQIIGCKISLELYQALQCLISAGVILLKPELDYLNEAFKIAIEGRITVYDALYVALARELGELLTCDEKQAKTAEKYSVKIYWV